MSLSKVTAFLFPSLFCLLPSSRSDRYIWRYVQPSEQSLAEALDELE
jgi:hypothetical protein